MLRACAPCSQSKNRILTAPADILELVEEVICPRECDHMCIESNYGPVCACRDGFRLYDDLRTCVLTEGKP